MKKIHLFEKLIWAVGMVFCTTLTGYIFFILESGYVLVYGYDIIPNILSGMRVMTYMMGSIVVVGILSK